MISSLESAIAEENEEAVQDAIYEISRPGPGQLTIEDEVAFEVLAILRRPEMWPSLLSGHVLNFFEFGAPHLSARAKERCSAFLREWGHQFSEIHSTQVVGELRNGPYLQPLQPKPARKKPRHNAA
jgi:hypothetical protein